MSADRLAEIKARIEAKLADWPDFFNVRSPLSAAETLRIIEQVEALTAERDALRAVVARVEALADAADDTDGEHSHRPYDDGEPYGEVCDCEIGDDHDATGEGQ